ncbi:cardiolipin synthase [Paenibacillus ferrarius]|uniref:cardiolipin synthase n=1 Tax=Paenibacillus ferrarius TaxID=1469647 RepID=UPI003D2A35B8
MPVHLFLPGLSMFDWISAINIVFALIVVFLERRQASITWAWLLVLIFFPVLGILLYIFLGQSLTRRKIYKLKKSTRLRLQIRRQQSLLSQQEVLAASKLHHDQLQLIRLNLQGNGALLTRDNDVTLLEDGAAKFDKLFQHIAEAKSHIHLLYYKFSHDALGRQLLEALTEKARQGVKVRVIYDSLGTSSTAKRFFRPLREAGGETASFFPPVVPWINFRMNFRNHRKIAIIDGRVGFIGGFNIGVEYLGQDPDFGYWRDTHLMLAGGSVLQLQHQFVLDWSIAAKRSIQQEPGLFPDEPGQGSTAVQIVASGPDSDVLHIRNALTKMIYAARKSIYIQTPYFVPDESLLTALKIAAASGVDVRIMVPYKSDHRLVQLATKSYLAEVVESGATGYLYRNGFLHAKTVVIDGRMASVGTANLDNRSFSLNFEVTAILYTEVKSRELERSFGRDEEASVPFNQIYRRSWWLRLCESAARLLSPIL